MPKISAKLRLGHPQQRCQIHVVGLVKWRCGSWKLTTVDAKCSQLSLVASLLHWASTLFVCSTSGVMQHHEGLSATADYCFVDDDVDLMLILLCITCLETWSQRLTWTWRTHHCECADSSMSIDVSRVVCTGRWVGQIRYVQPCHIFLISVKLAVD